MKKTIKYKAIAVIMGCLLATQLLMAQKVDYKDGLLKVDDKEVAKIVKIKDQGSFGLTSTYEVLALTGDKLIIATLATDFAERQNDNSTYYYRFSFMANQQQAIFRLSKLGPEKSLAKLIGQSGIVVNNQIDQTLLNEFIAKKSANPPVVAEYKIVERNHLGTPYIKGNQIYQGLTLIGQFKDITSSNAFDTYEFITPAGLVVAKVSFTGGINAQDFVAIITKDRSTQRVNIPTKGRYGVLAQREGVDRNEMTLVRIADKWYL